MKDETISALIDGLKARNDKISECPIIRKSGANPCEIADLIRALSENSQ